MNAMGPALADWVPVALGKLRRNWLSGGLRWRSVVSLAGLELWVGLGSLSTKA
jgi:hypothetical protein